MDIVQRFIDVKTMESARLIGAVLQTLGIREIEVDNRLLYLDGMEAEANPKENTTIIRLIDRRVSQWKK